MLISKEENVKKNANRFRRRITQKTSDVECGDRKVGFMLTETNLNLIRFSRVSITQAVNLALDNHFTFNITLYIIKHRLSNKYHIGFYEDHEPHDLHCHYIYNTGSGTLGDEIRKEGFGRYKLDIIGKFSDIKHVNSIFKYYRRKMKSHGGISYKSYRSDDNVDVLVKTYRENIGK